MHTESLERWTHDHTFGQEDRKAGESRTTAVALLTAAMMVIEIAAGLAFGSMALLADGLHMASHAAALGIAALAYYLGRRYAADPRFSFGTGKVNSLAGFTSAVVLALVAAMMAWDSVRHLLSRPSIDFARALPVAFLGLGVNLLSLWILGVDHDDHAGHHDHNLLSAYLHVAADAVTSVLAIVALVVGQRYGVLWMDPLMGLAGAALVAHWAFGLIRASGAILLDVQGPEELRSAIRAAIERENDCRLADLHVWSVGPSVYAASIALVTSDPKPAGYYRGLLSGERRLAHTTVEVHSCAH